MIWEGLVKFIEKLEDVGIASCGNYFEIWIDFNYGIRFYKSGSITLLSDDEPDILRSCTINRMYRIIKALTEEE